MGDDDRCRAALGRVLTRHFEADESRSRAKLGEALGTEGKSGATRASKLIGGELFPDRELGTIAQFLSLSLPELLRAIAHEIETIED